MDAVCLLVAGAVVATLAGPEVTLAWTHSVQKTRWEERYRADRDVLRLVEARVEGSGAGMEPDPAARRDGTGWTWRPDRAFASVTLAASVHGGRYELCDADRCLALPPPGAGDRPVTIAPCAEPRQR